MDGWIEKCNYVVICLTFLSFTGFLYILSCPFPSGFKLLLEVFSVIHGPQEECVRALRNGHLLGISPGGVREALFSDETYPLLWGKRKGFAQVAIDSQVVSSRYLLLLCLIGFIEVSPFSAARLT